MPTNPGYPGVYIEEVPSGEHTIAGVPTSITALIGQSVAGPLNQPVQVLSAAVFEQEFGTLTSGGDLACAVGHFFLNGGVEARVVRVPDSATDADWQAGLAALDAVDIVNLVVLPAVASPSVLAAAAAYCERRRTFLILDMPTGIDTPDQAEQFAASGAVPLSANAALYFPWVQIADPAPDGKPRWCPPSGIVAGIMARTDSNRGVWKAPAGEDATSCGVQGLKYPLTDEENGRLNSLAINCLRHFSALGIVVWGARTIVGRDATPSDWKYIPVRRLALFLEESLYRGTQWAVFEPNGEPLWAKLRLNVGAFMQCLFRQGAFQGAAPQEAYYVKCDKETTTQNDINNGVVNVIVGFAPLKPAEFVIIQIQQFAGRSP